MAELIIKLSTWFDDVSSAFKGQYTSSTEAACNEDYQLPTMESYIDDRANLKSDVRNISNDFGKAFQRYKEEELPKHTKI